MATQILKQSNTRKPGLLDFFRLPKIAEQILSVYDWLSGPPMSEQERINRELTVYDYREKYRNDAFLMGL